MLADAGESVHLFVNSGIAELGPKLGPIVWQFAATQRFDSADFEAFLKLLPPTVGGLPLRHAVDVRYESFKTPEYLALARRHGVTTVFTEPDEYPAFADITGSFVYTRIMRTEAQRADGLAPGALDALAECAVVWSQGGEPTGLPRVEPAPAPGAPREVFVFFISAAKEKAPAAAVASRRRLG